LGELHIYSTGIRASVILGILGPPRAKIHDSPSENINVPHVVANDSFSDENGAFVQKEGFPRFHPKETIARNEVHAGAIGSDPCLRRWRTLFGSEVGEEMKGI
jgi:hypothetical protein